MAVLSLGSFSLSKHMFGHLWIGKTTSGKVLLRYTVTS